MKPIPVACRSAHRMLGQSVVRLEDAPLLTGQGAFIGDIGFPHQLHMRIVRSAYANAVLRSVNVAAALAVPIVVAVWTAADIDDLPPIDFRDHCQLKQGWCPLAVGGAAVRCREVFGTPIGLPPLKERGPRRSTRPS